MAVEIGLSPEEITTGDLEEIYKCFCKAYGINATNRDLRFMRKSGMIYMRSSFGLDYRPFMGAKFFGQRSGRSTRFWGYVDVENLNEYKNEEIFGQYVKKYLAKKTK